MTLSAFQWHERPALVAMAARPGGRLAIWLVAAALLGYLEVTWLVAATMLLVMAFPERRLAMTGIAAIAATFEYFAVAMDLDVTAALANPAICAAPFVRTAIVVAVLFAMFRMAKFAHLLPKIALRNIVVLLHCAWWFVMAVVPKFTLFGAWIIWRLSYFARHVRSGSLLETSFLSHMTYLWPVFGGSSTPYAKGFKYLTEHEAKDSERFGKSQLAGIKLLLLAVVWQWVSEAFDRWIYTTTIDPNLEIRILPLHQAIHTSLSPLSSWLSVYTALVYDVITLAAAGHVIVGCIRLLGFNVFRNTYKPLLAESVVEFWNRYYYYFKELLVEFFFYPTFLRNSWASTRLRLLLAVFAAAFVGNMYYHLVTGSPRLVVTGQFDELWATWNSRLIYCFLLATGIWVSMVRQQRLRTNSLNATAWRRVRAIAGVWTFYGVIQIWNIGGSDTSHADRLYFALQLFGLREAF